MIATGVLTLTLAALPTAALASAARPGAPKQQSCPDVEFLGARGSGEKSIKPFRGLGPEVNKMFTVIQGMLHKDGITYGTMEVDYSAVSVDVLVPSPMGAMLGFVYWFNHNVHEFTSSINGGVADTITDLKDFHNLCPATDYVLGGYSQGAMVIHQAENSLSAKLRNTIAGTLLLGDGNRVIKTKAKEFGTSPANGQGIETWFRDNHFPGMPPVKDVPLPKTTANICNNHDIVCDFNASSFPHYSADAKVHTSYAKCNKKNQCTYEKVLTTAATWVGKAVIHRLIG